MPLPRTIDRIVEDQTVRLRRPWVSPAPLAFRPVLALSQRPGARGHELARRLCDDLRYALLDREIIHEIAERAHVSDRAAGRTGLLTVTPARRSSGRGRGPSAPAARPTR